MNQLPEIIRDIERVGADVVQKAATFQAAILADVAGRRRVLLATILGFLLFNTLTALSSSYAAELRERAAWLVSLFGDVSDNELLKITNSKVGEWGAEFAMESVLKVEDAEWQ